MQERTVRTMRWAAVVVVAPWAGSPVETGAPEPPCASSTAATPSPAVP